NSAANTIAFTVFTDTNGGGTPISGGAAPAGTTFSGDFLTAFPPASATTGLSGTPGYGMPLSFTTFLYSLPGTVTATNVTKTAAIPAEPPPAQTPGEPGLPAIGQQLNLQFGAVVWTLVAPVPDTAQT